MPLRLANTSTGLSLYARFFDGENVILPFTEGSGSSLRTYSISDAAISGAGLNAGTYYPCAYSGNYASPSDSDPLVATFPDGFVWSGTAELTLSEQLASDQPNLEVVAESKSIVIRTGTQ
jgi:hypothetical protein